MTDLVKCCDKAPVVESRRGIVSNGYVVVVHCDVCKAAEGAGGATMKGTTDVVVERWRRSVEVRSAVTK